MILTIPVYTQVSNQSLDLETNNEQTNGKVCKEKSHHFDRKQQRTKLHYTSTSLSPPNSHLLFHVYSWLPTPLKSKPPYFHKFVYPFLFQCVVALLDRSKRLHFLHERSKVEMDLSVAVPRGIELFNQSHP